LLGKLFLFSLFFTALHHSLAGKLHVFLIIFVSLRFHPGNLFFRSAALFGFANSLVFILPFFCPVFLVFRVLTKRRFLFFFSRCGGFVLFLLQLIRVCFGLAVRLRCSVCLCNRNASALLVVCARVACASRPAGTIAVCSPVRSIHFLSGL